MKRLLSFVISATLLAAMLAGCGGAPTTSSTGSSASAETAAAAGNSDGTLRLAWDKDIQTMDVHKTTDNYLVPLNVFDRLFEIEPDESGTPQLVPSLVEDYTVSDDGLTYNFTLRGGVKFSDGTPLTASDVKFTFTRMLTLPESVQSGMASMIAGAAELQAGTAQELTGITVSDDTHFTVTLSAPFAGFLYELATPACSIMSEANVTAAGDAFGQEPAQTIGSGAYVVTSWTRDSGMVLDLNPSYWGETPDVTHVEISIVPDPSTMSMMFQSGELDLLDCDYLDSAVVDSTYRTQYADRIVTGNRLATTYLALNENIEPLNNVQVRKAIQMAIDRQTILDSVYSGDGALVDGIYPAGLIGYSEDNQGWLTYDPEGAKALLAEAGYADGFTMELASDSSAASGVLLVLQIIQQNLADVGITAEIKSYDEASWLDLRNSGEMNAFVATWTADYNDPDNFIYTFFGSEDNARSRSLNYQNTEVIGRVAAAREIMDESARLTEYAALEKQIVQEDAAWVPLLSRTHLFVVGDRIASYTPHWAGYSDFDIAAVDLV